MFDPKTAVMEMLKHPHKVNLGNILEGDGDVSLPEQDIKDKQETKKLQGELSLIEKKRNTEIWRKGMLDRVKKEKVAVEHWGTIRSGNFKCTIGEYAPHGVRVAVVKDLGSNWVAQWLYKQLVKYYDKWLYEAC